MQKESPANSFLNPISYYIQQKRFRQAADSLLLLIRAFNFESAIFQFFENQMHEISFKDRKTFIQEIIKKVKWSRIIVRAYLGHEQKSKLQSFVDFLQKYLTSEADFYRNNNETDKERYFITKILNLTWDYTDIGPKKAKLISVTRRWIIAPVKSGQKKPKKPVRKNK